MRWQLLFRWVGLLFGLSGIVFVQAFFSLAVFAQALPEMPASFEATPNRPSKQKIEFWTMNLKPKFILYFRELVQCYQASHPHVQVEWSDFPWDILQFKLITAIDETHGTALRVRFDSGDDGIAIGSQLPRQFYCDDTVWGW